MESQRSLNGFRTFSETGINKIGPHMAEANNIQDRRQLHANKQLVASDLSLNYFGL